MLDQPDAPALSAAATVEEVVLRGSRWTPAPSVRVLSDASGTTKFRNQPHRSASQVAPGFAGVEPRGVLRI